MYDRTVQVLESNYEQLQQLTVRFESLSNFYKQILSVSELRVVAPPRPTAILLSVPQYRKIFNAIVEWFKLGIYDLAKEEFILSFVRVSDLYESYVLIKLFKYFKGIFQYKDSTVFDKSKKSAAFIFQDNEEVVTLFFQPIIYAGNYNINKEIGLYRNTSISIPEDTEEGKKEREGRYYNPDYIIKIERNEGTQFIILDAKFSTLETVKIHNLVSLTYKYLFSVSPFERTDKVLGLCIINGQSNQQNTVLTDVYNLHPKENVSVLPYADILTLTENKPDNESEHQRILAELLGKYLHGSKTL